MKFIPQSAILTDIYIPNYEEPKKQILDGTSLLLEQDSSSIYSIINLSPHIPFINNNKFDYDRKDWYWYDSNGFPYRFTWKSSYWELESVFGNNISSKTLIISTTTIPLEIDKNINLELGIYTAINDTEKLYKGIPLMVSVNGIPLKDITDYTNITQSPKLTEVNTLVNREFYYDPMQNKIFTNQNLEAISPSNIVVGLYTTFSEVSVKARLLANNSTSSYTTPVVDYFIVKLSGQNLRG